MRLAFISANLAAWASAGRIISQLAERVADTYVAQTGAR
jgi:hypothetical protein